jgi:hypothetical protein
MSSAENQVETKQTKSKGKKSKTIKSEDTNLVSEPVHVEQVLQEEVIISENDELKTTDVDIDVPEESSSDIEYLNNSDIIIEQLNIIENAYKVLGDVNLKNYDVNKDFFAVFTTLQKKINKQHFNFNQSTTDYIVKEQSVVIKKESKSTKKSKKNTDKSKCAINIPHDTYPEILQFMKLSPETQISKGNIMQAINAYVKKEKTSKNLDIFVEGDNRSFKIIGELTPLFDFIKSVMIERGDLSEKDDFPTQLTYTGIMKYLAYCFPAYAKK